MSRSRSSSIISLSICLIASTTGVLGQGSQSSTGNGARKLNTDPEAVPFVTSDISLFWQAYDMAKPENDINMFRDQYLRKGSVGLKEFAQKKNITSCLLADQIETHPKYYGHSNALSDTHAPRLCRRNSSGASAWRMRQLPRSLERNGFTNTFATWYGLSCFTVMAVGLSFICAWFRLMTGSLWPGAFSACKPQLVRPIDLYSTYKGHRKNNVLVDESGVGLAVVVAVTALVFWRLRSRLPDRQFVSVDDEAATSQTKDK
jgi:hypothetical protein